MAGDAPIDLVLPGGLWSRLSAHLFRADGDEHGAVIAAGIATTARGTRLLARELFLAQDGVDYVAGHRGYRMLTADFVRDHALYCRDERLAYLAVHNHFGRDAVAFSFTDLRSHARGYPALQDILGGPLVGGLVFAENAVAGDLWWGGSRHALRSAIVLGASVYRMYPEAESRPAGDDGRYERQARLFGQVGQARLRAQRVGVIGLGGVGSLVCELLSRLGVGELVLVDPDRVELSNLPRVVGSTMADIDRPKVDISARLATEANPAVQVEAIEGSIVDDEVARFLRDCDFLILAADTMQARLVFNALVHQYLIPGFQIGSKVTLDESTREVKAVFSVVRYVSPETGCLICNGLISPDRLAEEALSGAERRAQRYVDDSDVVAPSVITLNAVGASIACNEHLMRTVGLRVDEGALDWMYVDALTGAVRYEEPRKSVDCLECSRVARSRLARGDGAALPTRRVRP
jgi:hypothetical protein